MEILVDEIKQEVRETEDYEYKDISPKKHFVLNYHDANGRNEINFSQIKKFTTGKCFSIETFIRKNKPVAMGNYGIAY